MRRQRRGFPFSPGRFLRERVTLGSGQAPVKRYNEYLRDLIVNGRAQPGKIVSHHIDIDEAPDAYDKFDKRSEGYTKILIQFGDRAKAA